jgi:flagellar hook-associated protein 3 FlgL
MVSIRVTERSIATNTLANLQGNIAKLGDLQNRLSSGKQLTKASDAPGDAVLAMQYRSDVTNLQQYSRNADDGVAWLNTADTALTSAVEQVNRAKELVLSGMSSGSGGSQDARNAIALEMDNIRESVLNLANTQYLDRPVFGGTTTGQIAYNDDGTYAGDTGQVQRSVSSSAKIRVDTPAEGPDGVFGTGNTQVFTLLKKISDDLRNDPTQLEDDLGKLNQATTTMQAGLSSVGARVNRLTQLQNYADSRVIDLNSQVSSVEDIDLPKTITELTLQQTAYQAALAATAKVVQPSLVDFLR